VPLYLEWAPVDVFDESQQIVEDAKAEFGAAIEAAKVEEEKQAEIEAEDDDGELPEPESTLFVKNLNFSTVEADLIKVFNKIGKCRATVARKISNNKELLSMGYGFVEFKKKAKALEAIKKLQNHVLDGHQLELVLSNKQISTGADDGRNNKRKQTNKQADLAGKTPKILVRNVPFEAKSKEIEELFKVFGQLKYVRLPKKVDGLHRGFGFVEFMSVNDAKRAFEALCHSTHLFGRRLVLEWAAVEQTQDVELLRMKEAQISGPVSKRLKKSKILSDLGGDDDMAGAMGET